MYNSTYDLTSPKFSTFETLVLSLNSLGTYILPAQSNNSSNTCQLDKGINNYSYLSN